MTELEARRLCLILAHENIMRRNGIGDIAVIFNRYYVTLTKDESLTFDKEDSDKFTEEYKKCLYEHMKKLHTTFELPKDIKMEGDKSDIAIKMQLEAEKNG